MMKLEQEFKRETNCGLKTIELFYGGDWVSSFTEGEKTHRDTTAAELACKAELYEWMEEEEATSMNEEANPEVVGITGDAHVPSIPKEKLPTQLLTGDIDATLVNGYVSIEHIASESVVDLPEAAFVELVSAYLKAKAGA